MVKIVPFFSVEGLVQLYQLGKVVSLAIDGAARRSEKMRLKFLRSLRPPPKSPSGDFQKSFRTSSSFPPAIRWVCDLYCTQDVGQFPMAIFIFVKLRATGPKFNYCCGGLVPCDMLQWATWLYKVVCCGPLGQGGGVVFACSMRAYGYMLLVLSWVMIAGGYTALVMSVSFESSCYARTTHPHYTTHHWAAWFA